ncbi:serine/threonine protein kinase [Persicimonas caeni]|uniref:non-specific serine/threonine protein kinase n=1 Tax=Persicimonas caeni TaxID=2292766 RepID=A0A4Y6PU81_PERCE|nr:serine/threonine-protein kinase [Persicimonas caeni]QDG51886.1 serine/threonine protein kinase [Persicimonas caeni]QED33107.1 serine/threonine protein kinase [Persicimonas caeni]
MASNEQTAPTTLEPGEILLDRYVVEHQVAEGGMAAIHLTHDRATGEKVAIKVLYPYYSQNPVVCTRFLDEGRIQRYLDHPNIINVYDIVEQPQLAIIMEYIDGPTLDEYLQDHGPLEPQELLSLMLPVLSAVGFAHHKGVIHRDIKPSNILLQPSASGMVPKVMDFGVAKVERGGKDLTAAGTTVGTLHYMSPEQIVGSRDIDGRADIYSLGVTIYKLCTGDVPFNASTEFALMMAQVEARPTPPSELRPEISPRLEEIILKALAKKPADRYQSVKALTSALLTLKADEPDYDDTDTDTAPLPARLLEYAMMADEIAIDRTGELDITQFQELINETKETQEQAPPQVDTLDATVQLDASRLKAHVQKDADNSQELRTTAPMDRADRSPGADKSAGAGKKSLVGVDSQERTQPLPMADADTRESQNALTADTSSEMQSLSQETTHPFHSRDADRSQPIATEDVNTQDVTRPRVVKDEQVDPEPMRARAAGQDSLTHRAPDDAKQQIEQMARGNASLSRLQLYLLLGGLLLIAGLSGAIVWAIWFR